MISLSIESITLLKKRGFFVLFGLWIICCILFRIEVAIKEGNTENAKEEMLEEAKAMIRVSKHDHIVNFQGISVAKKKVYILLEFCSLGSIESYLQNNTKTYRIQLEQQNFKQVINWCIQIADAMEFLVKHEIIHVSSISRMFSLLHMVAFHY